MNCKNNRKLKTSLNFVVKCSAWVSVWTVMEKSWSSCVELISSTCPRGPFLITYKRMFYQLVADLCRVCSFTDMSMMWPSTPLFCNTSFHCWNTAILKQPTANPQVGCSLRAYPQMPEICAMGGRLQGSCPDRSDGGHSENVPPTQVTWRGCGAVSRLSCWEHVTIWEMHKHPTSSRAGGM